MKNSSFFSSPFLTLSVLLALLVGCNFEDTFSPEEPPEEEEPNNQEDEPELPLEAGEPCEEDEQCASEYCLVDLWVCAAGCDDQGCADGETCHEGLCLDEGYCDQGDDFGPGCPLICEEAYVEVEGECVLEEPCQVDNGGCGEELFFGCVNTGPGVSECEARDLCAEDNGGCGDGDRYECVNQSGRVPLCVFIAQCDEIFRAAPIEDAYVLEPSPTSNFGDRDRLLINPPDRSIPASFGGSTGRSQIFNKFDLSTLPQEGNLVGVTLAMMAYDGFAFGGNGNVYTHVVDNDWSAETLTYEDRPENLSGRLGSWFLWYGSTASDRWGLNRTTDLLPYLEAALVDDQVISFYYESSGYRTMYYGMSYVDEEKRPYLEVTVRTCETPQIASDGHASVASRATATPQGAEELLIDRDRHELYVRFDLSEIPGDASIIGASLSMTATSMTSYAGDHLIELTYTESDVWDETNITWDNRPLPVDASLDIREVDPEDFWTEVEVDGEFVEVATTTQVVFDTTELLDAVINRNEAAQSITFVLRSAGDAYEFANRFAEESTEHPILEVIYE